MLGRSDSNNLLLRPSARWMAEAGGLEGICYMNKYGRGLEFSENKNCIDGRG